MAPTKTITLAFDAYGTLLSTESIAKKLASHYGADTAAAVAQTWRKYQLEYTWRANSMNTYTPFSTLTQRSLIHAIAEHALPPLPPASLADLMSAYDSLAPFPDVPPALDALATEPDLTAVVFSNGTYDMISRSINHSPGLSPHAAVFSQIVVVEEVRKFKPAPEVYAYLAEKVGKKAEKGEGGFGDVWLVSSNPFDVVGAKAVGMRACWVDRGGGGWVDRLVEGEGAGPDVVVKGLGEVVGAVRGFEG
ncbi:haloacid dehalogenase [Lophium mytilinum]|uniref:Haloacid dehalogenase n=1 Tax=Lophium mytilinum TaxID=390894 RepID=A0A6A6RAS4_9PEZI|nr:haloacid dehalogenase [Lophium mytilinum]